MGEMHGARRVITFCLLTAVLPTILLIIPLYLRHSLYADVSYVVAESDVLEVRDGISPLFCQEQVLRMNSTFHAFQLSEMPPLSHHKKNIKLRKSMALPDDTVEYWGFYLLKGSKVTLLACSRYDGAGILVVKSDKTLKTCNVMEPQHKPLKYQKSQNSPNLPKKFSSKENIPSSIHDNHKTQMLLPSQFNAQSKQSQVPIPGSNKTVQKIPNIDEFTKELKEYITNYNNSYRNIKNIPQNSNEELQPSNYKQNVQKVDSVNVIEVEKQNVSRSKNVHNRGVESTVTSNRLAEELLNPDEDLGSQEGLPRLKRNYNTIVPGHILDAAIGHGGNANLTEPELESSDSSFEDSLHKCYEGQELFSEEINQTLQCYSNFSLEHFLVKTIHITSDGYYYFIFYSDNDYHLNPVHAEFDLFKTTYEHTNYTRGCINQTECRFPISFGSKEIVIVEVPTHDGIAHEDGDSSVLASSCYPRMSVYAIFPVAVLFLILGCAFL